MKPFEVGKTYKTTEGYDVRILCTDRKFEGAGNPIVGLQARQGLENVVFFRADGSQGTFGIGSLVPEKQVVHGWVRVYTDDDGDSFFDRAVYYSEQAARKDFGGIVRNISFEY